MRRFAIFARKIAQDDLPLLPKKLYKNVCRFCQKNCMKGYN